MGAVKMNSVEHGDFLRCATGTDVDPDWYGREVTMQAHTGTPTGWITRRYTVAGMGPRGYKACIRLRDKQGRDAWCTVAFVREQLGYKPAAPRAPRVRALDLGLG